MSSLAPGLLFSLTPVRSGFCFKGYITVSLVDGCVNSSIRGVHAKGFLLANVDVVVIIVKGEQVPCSGSYLVQPHTNVSSRNHSFSQPRIFSISLTEQTDLKKNGKCSVMRQTQVWVSPVEEGVGDEHLAVRYIRPDWNSKRNSSCTNSLFIPRKLLTQVRGK